MVAPRGPPRPRARSRRSLAEPGRAAARARPRPPRTRADRRAGRHHRRGRRRCGLRLRTQRLCRFAVSGPRRGPRGGVERPAARRHRGPVRGDRSRVRRRHVDPRRDVARRIRRDVDDGADGCVRGEPPATRAGRSGGGPPQRVPGSASHPAGRAARGVRVRGCWRGRARGGGCVRARRTLDVFESRGARPRPADAVARGRRGGRATAR